MPTSGHNSVQALRLIQFLPPAPMVWAAQIDAFARRGVAVEITQTTSSDEIGAGLADGRYDVGIGVADNAIGWGAERGADLVVAAQLERRLMMRFVAAPGMATLARAAAAPIAVDATTNGFVLVLYRALARAGIDRAACRFDTVGGVRHRFEALVEGRATSTILVPPLDAMATAQGFHVLWDGADLAPDYPGVVAVVQRATPRAEAVVRFLAALRDAVAWATDPAHAEQARAALVAARYAPDAAAALVADAMPDLRPVAAGIAETIALRVECGLPLADPARLIDHRFLDAGA